MRAIDFREIYPEDPLLATLGGEASMPSERAHEDVEQLSAELARKYDERWREQLAEAAAEAAARIAIGAIGDTYQSPFVRDAAQTAAQEAARIALGLKELPRQEGEA